VLKLQYTHDPAGNLSSLTDGTAVASFTYDELNRLTGAYGQSYAYDSAGRLTASGGRSFGYGAAPSHGVQSVSDGASYTYDADGNLSRRTAGIMQDVFTWDGANRPVAVRGPAAPPPGPPCPACTRRTYFPLVATGWPAEQYGYDGDGHRIAKTSGGTTTYYVTPDYEVTVTAGGGSQSVSVTKYYEFAGQRIALRQGTGTPVYLHADHLGSVQAATDAGGALVNGAQPRYDAYGQERVGGLAQLPTDYTFTGQKWNRYPNLYLLGARTYDPYLNQ
jgi:YD repeat-containing protein